MHDIERVECHHYGDGCKFYRKKDAVCNGQQSQLEVVHLLTYVNCQWNRRQIERQIIDK